MKEYFISPCPCCGFSKGQIVHVLSARLPWWYFLECERCHYCGKTKLLKARAIIAWEKEGRRMSKCHVNWARTPNSRMDRKTRPKQFFRGKNRIEDFRRIEKIEQDRIFKMCDQKCKAEDMKEVDGNA